MAQISTEQALQIPQQLKQQRFRSGSDQQGSVGTGSPQAKNEGIGDETVTLNSTPQTNTRQKIRVEDYKQSVGQDNSFIQESLKQQLRAHGLSPNTPITLSKDLFGNLELKAPILQNDLESIRKNLSESPEFNKVFSRLSQQQPTLNYMDNVVKIAKAYGADNSVFNSLISENEQFNGLHDIAHRYEALKSNTEHDLEGKSSEGFHLVIN